MKDPAAHNALKTKQWRSVRLRIDRINADVEQIRQELVHSGDSETQEVLNRLESLQEKFDRVMGQLASIDDGGEEIIRSAKEDFRSVVRRYQRSRRERAQEVVH